MPDLAQTLARHGALVLLVGMCAGVALHAAIRRGQREPGWHLVHAGVSGRGIMLIALAGVARWIQLPARELGAFLALLLFFVWSSTAAMVFGALLDVRGQRWEGRWTNRAMYAAYVAGAVAVFPAMVLLLRGLW